MVKTLNGCLSDLAGKAQYPEFVPLDIAAQDKMAAVHLQKHPLKGIRIGSCLLYTSPSPRDQRGSRMPSSA